MGESSRKPSLVVLMRSPARKPSFSESRNSALTSPTIFSAVKNPWARVSTPKRRGIQRSVWTGRRGIIRHGRQPVHVEIHNDDISGPEGDRQGGVLHDLPEREEPGLGERHYNRSEEHT